MRADLFPFLVRADPFSQSPTPNAQSLKVEFIRGEGMGGGVGGMVYSIRDGNIICSHANHRGDIIARSNFSGSLTSYALYEAYGTRPYEWGSDPDRQKANTKEEESDLGLLNEGMRFRDLETGTFLTRDPIGFGDGPNMYCYVHCNPITRFDALGLSENDVNKAAEKVAESGQELTEAADAANEASEAGNEAYNEYKGAQSAYEADKNGETKRARDRAKSNYRKATEAYQSAANTRSEALQTYRESVGNLNQALLDTGVSQKVATDLIHGGSLTVSSMAFNGVESIQSGRFGFWMSKSTKSAPFGKFYLNSVPGNGVMGGRVAYAARMERYAKVGGNFASGLTVTSGIADFGTGMYTGDYDQAVMGGVDAISGAAGFFGPIGQGYAAYYGVLRMADDSFGISDRIGDTQIMQKISSIGL